MKVETFGKRICRLVSLEAFREELFQVMQSPGYMKPICESGKYRESMERIQEFLKKV